MEKKNEKVKELINGSKGNSQPKEVSLEQLESLCYTFGRRGRGCALHSTEDSDDVLF